MYIYVHTVMEDGKGYGFVQFFDEVERDICCMEMNGKAGLGQKLISMPPAIIPKYVAIKAILLILVILTSLYLLSYKFEAPVSFVTDIMNH